MSQAIARALRTAAGLMMAGLLATTAMAQAPKTPPAERAAPPGAHNGYPIPIEGTKCAMWMTSDEPPQEGDVMRWSGGCRQGYGDGFGVQDLLRADGSRQRYIGTVRNGMWNGVGRTQEWDAQGQVYMITEGIYRNDMQQGVIVDLVRKGHPEVANYLKDIEEAGAGRPLGETMLQLESLYKEDEQLHMCQGKGDCAREAVAAGHQLPTAQEMGLEGAMLAYGGWRFERQSRETSERTGQKTVDAAPANTALCIEAKDILPGREPWAQMLTFPSYRAWLNYLRMDYHCEDLSASRMGDRLSWKSQCASPDGHTVLKLSQLRSFKDKALNSEIDVVLERDGQPVSHTHDQVKGRFVGACTPDMLRAGDLRF